MARSQLSTEFLRGAFAQETGVCPVFLLTIAHASLAQPIRASSDPTERIEETPTDVIYGTRSRGNDYVFFPFTLILPTDEDEGPKNMQLTLDNVTRQYTETLRSIVGPPTIMTEIVLAQSPDTVEASWPDFLLTNASYDAATITGTLELETLQREPFPYLCFSPAYFPALF
jgi:hypothetical protein